MEKKNLIILIAAIVVVLIAVAGYVFVTGMSNSNENVQTSPLNTPFMAGSFIGNVKMLNNTTDYQYSFEDSEHHVTYNISTIDNVSALMEIYRVQDGIANPDERTFNGNDWNIYFTQAVASNETNVTESNTMNIVICECQGPNQGYLIYAIFDANSTVNASGEMYSDAYLNYIEPLLKSITLKESENVPHIYDEFGMTESQFVEQMDLIQQLYAGNYSGLEG